jgi:hypothetical protein
MPIDAGKSSAHLRDKAPFGAFPLSRFFLLIAVALAARTARVLTSGWLSRGSTATAAPHVPGPNPREAKWAGLQTRHRMRRQPRQQP